MKKTLIILLALLIPAAAAGCGKKASTSVTSAVSSSSQLSLSSQPASAIGDDFAAITFELNAKSTADWVKFKSLSDPIAVRYSLWMPPEWTAAEDSVTFTDNSGRIVCEVLAPVMLSDTQELPDVPGDKDTSNGKISSTADIGLSNMRGKCVVRQLSENSSTVYLYQYYMLDDDIVYRVTFRSYTGDEGDKELFNTVMDRLVNGK
ncbi:MAG TPA: hypothetical protein PK854_00490 [Oscillospiraceae bacterium]|nr:hypothetical protein [Oscillospiraceae bacterium]HPS33730.1 hypothetical protein [Oscillospiraceae bacterium]